MCVCGNIMTLNNSQDQRLRNVTRATDEIRRRSIQMSVYKIPLKYSAPTVSLETGCLKRRWKPSLSGSKAKFSKKVKPPKIFNL